jgi:hypothetical protein
MRAAVPSGIAATPSHNRRRPWSRSRPDDRLDSALSVSIAANRIRFPGVGSTPGSGMPACSAPRSSAGNIIRAWLALDGEQDARVRHACRSAVVIGNRAARHAGNRPPMKPITSAITRPVPTSCGVTLKANTTWVKFCPSVDTEKLLNSK